MNRTNLCPAVAWDDLRRPGGLGWVAAAFQIAQGLRFHPADFVVRRWLEQRIHQELRVFQKGQPGAAHKIHL